MTSPQAKLPCPQPRSSFLQSFTAGDKISKGLTQQYVLSQRIKGIGVRKNDFPPFPSITDFWLISNTNICIRASIQPSFLSSLGKGSRRSAGEAFCSKGTGKGVLAICLLDDQGASATVEATGAPSPRVHQACHFQPARGTSSHLQAKPTLPSQARS